MKNNCSLTEEQRYVLVKQGIEKLESILRETQIAKENEIWDTLANRIYFATFRAVSTLLTDNGIQMKTHKGIVAQFGKYFIKTNIFPKEDGQLVSVLQSLREAADYEGTFFTTRDKIVPLYDKAMKFIAKIQTILKESQTERERNLPTTKIKENTLLPSQRKP